MSQPLLETPRLILRPLGLEDAPRVQELAGDARIAATTQNIPHPYDLQMAERWIKSHPQARARRESLTYAVCKNEKQLASSGPASALIGCIGLSLEPANNRAALGYWIGWPYWNQGYCTEAAQPVVRFVFERLELNRLYAQHLCRNPGSGRVMQKLGMRYEGRFLQHALKDGRYEDIDQYALLRDDWQP